MSSLRLLLNCWSDGRDMARYGVIEVVCRREVGSCVELRSIERPTVGGASTYSLEDRRGKYTLQEGSHHHITRVHRTTTNNEDDGDRERHGHGEGGELLTSHTNPSKGATYKRHSLEMFCVELRGYSLFKIDAHVCTTAVLPPRRKFRSCQYVCDPLTS